MEPLNIAESEPSAHETWEEWADHSLTHDNVVRKIVENPELWGLAEHVVNRALNEADMLTRQGICGLSDVRRITDALRSEGLLKEDDDNGS